MGRPNWDEYFIHVIEVIAERSTCDRGKSGALIAKDNRILATGYVGSPPGMPHCDDIGHEMVTVTDDKGNATEHCVRTIHAEYNALSQAAKFGVSVNLATMYSKMVPCYSCATAIVGAGLVRVVTAKDYHVSARSKELFQKRGIGLLILDPNVETYKRM